MLSVTMITTTGCVFSGLLRSAPIARVEGVSISVPPDTDFAALASRAAIACKMSPQTISPDVVRCSLASTMWSMAVDVRFSGNAFSIEYVSSEGLWYNEDSQRIHSGYNRRVEKLSRQIVKEASILRAPAQNVARAVSAGAAQVPAAAPAAKPYRVESFVRESGESFAYRFDLLIVNADAVDLTFTRRVQADLRESVRAEYVSATGNKGERSELRIDFPEYSVSDGHVRGRAVVLSVRLEEFVYDSVTRRGRLAVRVDARQYEATRRWVRDNIATLARDKDKTIFQAISVAPKFTIGKEVLRDDGVLEVEFHTSGVE